MVQVRCYEILGLEAVQQGIELTQEGTIALGQETLLLPNISTVRAGRLEAMPVSNERAVAVIVIRAPSNARWELVRPYPASVLTEFLHAAPCMYQGDVLLVAEPGVYNIFVREDNGQARLVQLVVSEGQVMLA
jgi:hypothetical protein